MQLSSALAARCRRGEGRLPLPIMQREWGGHGLSGRPTSWWRFVVGPAPEAASWHEVVSPLPPPSGSRAVVLNLRGYHQCRAWGVWVQGAGRAAGHKQAGVCDLGSRAAGGADDVRRASCRVRGLPGESPDKTRPPEATTCHQPLGQRSHGRLPLQPPEPRHAGMGTAQDATHKREERGGGVRWYWRPRPSALRQPRLHLAVGPLTPLEQCQEEHCGVAPSLRPGCWGTHTATATANEPGHQAHRVCCSTLDPHNPPDPEERPHLPRRLHRGRPSAPEPLQAAQHQPQQAVVVAGLQLSEGVLRCFPAAGPGASPGP